MDQRTTDRARSQPSFYSFFSFCRIRSRRILLGTGRQCFSKDRTIFDNL